MPDDSDKPSNADKSNAVPTGPGSTHMKPRWIVVVGVYLVLVSALVLYGLIKLWPYPTPSGERPATGQVAGPPTSTSQTNDSTSGSGNSQGGAETVSGGSPNPALGSESSQTPPGTNGSTTPPSRSGNSQPAEPSDGLTPGQFAQIQTQLSNAVAGVVANQKPARPLPDPERINFFGGRFRADVYLETRLLLLVMLAGALGSLMHALRSLYWYTGNRMMVWSWVALYFLLPVTGAILATIFYFVVRGGFFSSQASFDNTSPFGFAALSALVGLFSQQATLKLKDVAETIFSKPEAGTDNKPQESLSPTPSPKPAPTITSVSPASGVANDLVVIAGTNFSDGVVVRFGEVAGTVSSVSATTLNVIVPANPSVTGPVDVQVINSDDQKVTLSQGFTYLAGGG